MRYRCNGLLAFFLLSLGAPVFSQPWQVDSAQSLVRFSIRNFGFEVDGTLMGLAGTIDFDANDLERSVFNISISASTIETGIKLRDQHLKARDYLDVKTYPTIRFQSTLVRKNDETGRFDLHGKLNIKRTTRDIAIVFLYHNDGQRIRFNGSFKLNRLDFDIGKSSISLSDEVLVEIEAVAIPSRNLP